MVTRWIQGASAPAANARTITLPFGPRHGLFVISGKWCQGNVALLLSLHPWQWDIEGEKHGGLFVSISTSLTVCSARLFLPTPATDLIVAFASCNVVRTLVAAVKKGIKKREIVHGFRFEAGSASLIVNNKELLGQPVLPLDGLVHIITRMAKSAWLRTRLVSLCLCVRTQGAAWRSSRKRALTRGRVGDKKAS